VIRNSVHPHSVSAAQNKDPLREIKLK